MEVGGWRLTEVDGGWRLEVDGGGEERNNMEAKEQDEIAGRSV